MKRSFSSWFVFLLSCALILPSRKSHVLDRLGLCFWTCLGLGMSAFMVFERISSASPLYYGTSYVYECHRSIFITDLLPLHLILLQAGKDVSIFYFLYYTTFLFLSTTFFVNISCARIKISKSSQYF